MFSLRQTLWIIGSWVRQSLKGKAASELAELRSTCISYLVAQENWASTRYWQIGFQRVFTALEQSNLTTNQSPPVTQNETNWCFDRYPFDLNGMAIAQYRVIWMIPPKCQWPSPRKYLEIVPPRSRDHDHERWPPAARCSAVGPAHH